MEVVGNVCGVLSVIIGIYFAGSVSVDSIYGYYPESYGMPAMFGWPLAFFCTIMSIAGLWFIGVLCFVVFVAIVVHLHQIRGPRGWYDNNTDPPPRNTDNSLKDLE